MKITLASVASIVLLALGSQSAMAADKTEIVQFNKGAHSATISGSITGDDGVVYKLRANAGQVMSILFAPKNSSCYFNLLPPGSNEAIHIGSTSGNEFAGTLGVGGEYKTQVYLMRNAARRNETCFYKITFEISGASGYKTDSSSRPSDQAMRNACTDQAASMYGVKHEKVRLSNNGTVFPASDGFSIEGEVDKGAEGKRQFNCIFNPNRSLKTVMPLNSDGE